MSSRVAAGVSLLLVASTPLVALAASPDPDTRADATIRQMTADERVQMLHGQMAIALPGLSTPPAGAIPGAGQVKGIARLGIPTLAESDASLGVAYVFGLRKDGATALPSGMALGSTWNPELQREGGAMIAREAHSKGFNVLLAGGANLIREPRGGRTFEYLSEDPWLTGTMAGAAIAGIQSEHVISTIKHFAVNDMETGRNFHDAQLGEAAARESDLLAFQIAIERGQPGSVMCAYNRINGDYACGNDFLLNQVLKRDWGYRGWVMSDWGAVHALDYAIKGLDQQSGEQLDSQVFFGERLRDEAAKDASYAARVADMNHRILRTVYAVGADTHPPQLRPIEFKANGDVAEKAARQGIVLLRNQGGALPLDASRIKHIAVIGGYSDSGVPAGGGSSTVQGEGGPAVSRPVGGDSPIAALFGEAYHRSVPLKAIRARAPMADIVFRNGRYIADAVIAARKADVAIVFATQVTTEGLDVPELNLPDGQDALIAAVCAANPRTIVVLETGGPVVMPWLDRSAAVLEAWFAGARGADAIAAVLFGDVNPSGRLPVSFPANVTQLPRPALPGAETIEQDVLGNARPGQSLEVPYDVEGADVGYRWYARTGKAPLFWFGYGLSYTSFETDGLKATAGKSSVILEATARNTGARAGDDVVQFYLTGEPQGALRRLIGYQRVSLAPGESRRVSVEVDPRLLAHWRNGGWQVDAGTYQVATGRSAGDLGAATGVKLAARRWTERQAAQAKQ
jgi:beta-glucosidase